ncbi:MAG: Holliday junction branch migration DNA helicase RuvB, partial [Calditrichaeota bacterium]
LQLVTRRSAHILGIQIGEDAALEIASRSRGTPRVANRLLRRVRDFAQIAGKNSISLELARDALMRMDVDEGGLDEMDKRILLCIIDKFGGGPVGLNTLAMAIGEESDTIEEVYEPYLIQEGFIQRTPRGRAATDLAFDHFKRRKKTGSQPGLF